MKESFVAEENNLKGSTQPEEYLNELLKAKNESNLLQLIDDLKLEKKIMIDKVRNLEKKLDVTETKNDMLEYDKGNLLDSFKNVLNQIKEEKFDSEGDFESKSALKSQIKKIHKEILKDSELKNMPNSNIFYFIINFFNL